MDKKITSYRDLIVWQKAMDLCIMIYGFTKEYPKSEIYSLVFQTRRCSISIPSNIAEGFQRKHKAEYIQFLYISFGSGAEMETQLLIALRIGYINQKQFDNANLLLGEIMKMLNSLISSLENGRKTITYPL
jgi:four helix bundle protein